MVWIDASWVLQAPILLYLLTNVILVFVSATIYPSIPEMVRDFNSTPQVIGYARVFHAASFISPTQVHRLVGWLSVYQSFQCPLGR